MTQYVSINVTLKKYWLEIIDRLIESGKYNSRAEVVRCGLRTLKELESE